MTERLRKVAQLAPAARIVFFRQETHVVAHGEQAFEQLSGIVVASKQNEIVSKPKTAGEKRPFAGRQSDRKSVV